MEEMNNVVSDDTVEVAVEETVKAFDGESFALGAAVGMGAIGAGLALYKWVVKPVVKKVKVSIEKRKYAIVNKDTEPEEAEFQEE